MLLYPGQLTLAQFPTKQIEMTVPFGAGNAADVTARHLAEGMAKRLGVPVPVVNRTGGGGAVAFTHVMQQRPDGYSVGYITSTISTSYYSGVTAFDHTAFAPVARVTIETPVLVVRADAPWRSVGEMVEDAKQNPGKLRIGNSEIGTHTHLSASALFLGSGAKVIDVPFGEGQATVNLLGGDRGRGPASPCTHRARQERRPSRPRCLGVQRDRIFPDTPTATESGFPVALDLWRGIVVPKSTPADVIRAAREVRSGPPSHRRSSRRRVARSASCRLPAGR